MFLPAIEKLEEISSFFERLAIAAKKAQKSDKPLEEIAEKMSVKLKIEDELLPPTPLAQSIEAAELESATKCLTKSKILLKNLEQKVQDIID